MPTRPSHPSGFTLTELLVSIGIIGVLTALVLSAVGRAMAAGQQVACVSQLRQITAAFTAYARDLGGAPELEAGRKAKPGSLFGLLAPKRA